MYARRLRNCLGILLATIFIASILAPLTTNAAPASRPTTMPSPTEGYRAELAPVDWIDVCVEVQTRPLPANWAVLSIDDDAPECDTGKSFYARGLDKKQTYRQCDIDSDFAFTNYKVPLEDWVITKDYGSIRGCGGNDGFEIKHRTRIPPQDPGDPGDKGDAPPYRCRNFEETWQQTYEVRLSGSRRRTSTRDFAETRVFVRACYNGKRIYREGMPETSFRLNEDPSRRGFRPLPSYYETFRIPEGEGEENYSTSSLRVNFNPYFALPNRGLSAAGVSVLGFGINASFRDSGAEVRYAEYAINIDTKGCYIYTGGGNRKKCPHGRYDP